MQIITQFLKEAQDDMVEAGARLIDANERYYKIENKYNLLRGKLMNMDKVAQQPNQAMREAEIETLLNNDERFRPIFQEYSQTKFDQKKAWIEYEIAKEINSNQRTILNSMIYGDK